MSKATRYEFITYFGGGESDWSLTQVSSGEEIVPPPALPCSSFDFNSEKIAADDPRLHDARLTCHKDGRTFRFLTNESSSAINVNHQGSQIEKELKSSPYCFGPVTSVKTTLWEYNPLFVGDTEAKV